MNEDDILLEDWKITKDRIKHFDDVIMKTRVQGLPIATTIQAAAFASLGSIGKISIQFAGFDLHVFSLIIFAGLVYLVPILLLDLLHYKLLLKAVAHAKSIEERPQFVGKLEITHKLSSRGLSFLHAAGGYGVYIVVFASGIYFALIAVNDIIKSLNI